MQKVAITFKCTGETCINFCEYSKLVKIGSFNSFVINFVINLALNSNQEQTKFIRRGNNK